MQQRIKIEKEVEQSRGGHVEQWAGGRCEEVWTWPRMRRKSKLEIKEETKQNVERAVTTGCAKPFVSVQGWTEPLWEKWHSNAKPNHRWQDKGVSQQGHTLLSNTPS